MQCTRGSCGKLQLFKRALFLLCGGGGWGIGEEGAGAVTRAGSIESENRRAVLIEPKRQIVTVF